MADDTKPAEESGFSLTNPFAAPDDHHEDEPEEAAEAPPASMSMTKAELLDRLHEMEAELTKAQILDRIHALEGGHDEDAPEAPAAPVSTETRSATIDGRTLTWTDATAHQVPDEYVAVERRSRGMAG